MATRNNENRSSGSQTSVIYNNESKLDEKADTKPVLRLKLKPRDRVTWTEDTVDNEHLGKKSSKSEPILHHVLI